MKKYCQFMLEQTYQTYKKFYPRLFEKNIGGIYTPKASKKALANNWLSKKEDKAWQHLQREN